MILQRRQPLAHFLFGQVSKNHRTTLLFAYSSKAGGIERHKQNCWPPPGSSGLPGLKAPRIQPWEAFPRFSRQLISHPLTDLEKGYKVSAEGNSSGKRKSAVCSLHQHARLSRQHTHLTAESTSHKVSVNSCHWRGMCATARQSFVLPTQTQEGPAGLLGTSAQAGGNGLPRMGCMALRAYVHFSTTTSMIGNANQFSVTSQSLTPHVLGCCAITGAAAVTQSLPGQKVL